MATPRQPRVAPGTVTLRLEMLARDEGVQSRTRLDDETVARYAELMAESEEFPPLAVFDDGERLWLADGFHRGGHRVRTR
jgi:hypothetical protein